MQTTLERPRALSVRNHNQPELLQTKGEIEAAICVMVILFTLDGFSPLVKRQVRS